MIVEDKSCAPSLHYSNNLFTVVAACDCYSIIGLICFHFTWTLVFTLLLYPLAENYTLSIILGNFSKTDPCVVADLGGAVGGNCPPS